MSDTKDIEELGELIAVSMKAYGERDARSVQSADGIIGMSDLGFCRQKALLMLRGIPQSDPDNITAAQIVTAIHDYYRKAMDDMFPDWIADKKKLVCRFPSGYEVPGTPDLIVPEYNAIVDWKSVDGTQKIRRYGVSVSQRYQRFGYAHAAVQAGLLDPTRPIWVANYFIDRSAREKEPYFTFEQYDESLAIEIDEWISDVTYAAKQNEDASRDIPSPVCAMICSHFTVCRGGLEVHDGQEVIDDLETIKYIDMASDGREYKKLGDLMYEEARAALVGINGVTDTYQVRWVEVGSKGTMRLDIVPLPERISPDQND